MTRNRKAPSISAIETMSDREKAILLVLSEADEALDHKQICMRIAEPWYENRKSFRASVGSQLGVMRAKGLIKARLLPTGDPRVMTKARLWIEPKIRVWTTNGHKIERPPAYHHGGFVAAMDFARFGDHPAIFTVSPAGLRPYQRDFMRRSYARPRTGDMVQMLDDISRVEQVIVRKIVLTFR